MTYDTLVNVIKKYEDVLDAHSVSRGDPCKLCHIKWMLYEMKKQGPETLDKLFRWLGFIQGVLWTEGVFTIDEMRQHNWDAGTNVYGRRN